MQLNTHNSTEICFNAPTDLYAFPKPSAVVRNGFKVRPNEMEVHRLERCAFCSKGF